MLRRLLLCLPAVAAAIVGWALLGGGAQRVRYVQVLGGPTRSGPALSLLLRAIELEDERRVPIAGLELSASASSAERSARARGVTDASGHVELTLDLGATPAADPWLRVEAATPDAPRVLAEGPLALGVERWRADARQDGGWLRGQTAGELRVRVAVTSGVLAVPFAGELALQVLGSALPGAESGDAARLPVEGARASVECDGAELVEGEARATDAAGQTRVALRPLEHAVSARIVVRSGDRRGDWYGALPVIPGASSARLTQGELELRSPIARERVFVSLVGARERIAGMVVPLAMESDGSARGRWPLTAALRGRLETEAIWAVVSSEDDKRSGGVVGWPLSPAFDPAAPASTFGVPDQLLLDGRSGALYDVAEAGRARRQIAAAGLLGVAIAMGLAFWSEVERGRRPARAASDDRPALAPGGWRLGIALGCIVIGMALLAYFGLLPRPN